MARYSPEQISRPNLIQRRRVARNVAKIASVFEEIRKAKEVHEVSNPIPKSKTGRVTISLAHRS